MRCHFDFIDLKRHLDWKFTDYDIVYSFARTYIEYKNLFENDTNIDLSMLVIVIGMR